MLGRKDPNLAPLLCLVSGKKQPVEGLLSKSALWWTLSVAAGGRQSAVGGVVPELRGCRRNVFKVCSLPESPFHSPNKSKTRKPSP